MTSLDSISRDNGVILLYHATFNQVPEAMQKGLHNVEPDALYRHLERLQEDFKFVTIDEFAQAKSFRGLASVTFDDGYKIVLKNALPVFEALDIPFTIFINSATLVGEVFWRDKVRLIINNGWVGAFEKQMHGIQRIANKSFYRYSKHHTNNSLLIDRELDQFLADKNIPVEDMRYCFDDENDLIRHPLVHYGNHSHSHYVMSSLSESQQAEEIEKTRQFLAQQSGLSVSSLFSLPFGGETDFNSTTIGLLHEAGYEGMLLSRGRLHRESFLISEMPCYERFMPQSGDIVAQLQQAVM